MQHIRIRTTIDKGKRITNKSRKIINISKEMVNRDKGAAAPNWRQGQNQQDQQQN